MGSKSGRRYAAFLRAISNLSMEPFREGMVALGFKDVTSFGMSGNLLFNSSNADQDQFEAIISDRFKTPAIVRNRADLARIVEADPFGSTIMFLTKAPSAHQRRLFLEHDFDHPQPVLRGRTIYFIYPARLRGKISPFDFESGLKILGTLRSARVVDQILNNMYPGGNPSFMRV